MAKIVESVFVRLVWALLLLLSCNDMPNTKSKPDFFDVNKESIAGIEDSVQMNTDTISNRTMMTEVPRWGDRVRVKFQAQLMYQYFLNNDFLSFVKCMLPEFIERQGGAARVSEMIAQQMREIHDEGSKILSIKVGQPDEVILFKQQLQTTIPYIMRIQYTTNTDDIYSSVLALSDDGGVTWYFVDASTPEELKKQMNNLSGKLKFPFATITVK